MCLCYFKNNVFSSPGIKTTTTKKTQQTNKQTSSGYKTGIFNYLFEFWIMDIDSLLSITKRKKNPTKKTHMSLSYVLQGDP